jgi:hypothetical protein
VPGAVFLGVKQPWHEADHSPPSSAEIKNVWSISPLPQYVFMVWCLVKHRDNFTFYLCSELKDTDMNLQRYNKINSKIKRNFGTHISMETKLCLHSNIPKATLITVTKLGFYTKRKPRN